MAFFYIHDILYLCQLLVTSQFRFSVTIPLSDYLFFSRALALTFNLLFTASTTLRPVSPFSRSHPPPPLAPAPASQSPRTHHALAQKKPILLLEPVLIPATPQALSLLRRPYDFSAAPAQYSSLSRRPARWSNPAANLHIESGAI